MTFGEHQDPRLFQLHRDEDVSGVSGTGVVADGVEWPDGTVAIRWRATAPEGVSALPQSTVVWECIEHAEMIHGHDGRTRIVWIG